MRRMMFSLLALGLTACFQVPAAPEAAQKLVRFGSYVRSIPSGGDIDFIALNGHIVGQNIGNNEFTSYFELLPGKNKVEIFIEGQQPVLKTIDAASTGKNTAYLYGDAPDVLMSVYENAPPLPKMDDQAVFYRFINLYYKYGGGAKLFASRTLACPPGAYPFADLPADQLVPLASVGYGESSAIVRYALNSQDAIQNGGRYDLLAEGSAPLQACTEVNQTDYLGKFVTVVLAYDGYSDGGGSVVIVKD